MGKCHICGEFSNDCRGHYSGSDYRIDQYEAEHRLERIEEKLDRILVYINNINKEVRLNKKTWEE